MKNTSVVKLYLKHKNPDELIRLQAINNAVHNISFDYDIIYAKGFWFAWYEADLEVLKWRDRFGVSSK